MLARETSKCQMMMSSKEKNSNSLPKSMSLLFNMLKSCYLKKSTMLLYQTDLLMNHVLLLLILTATALSWTKFKKLKCSQVLLTIQFLTLKKSWKSILITKSIKLFCKRFKYFIC